MKQELIFKDLHFDGKNWSDESLRIMEDMLAVYDSGHTIIICHPNIVFLNKPISSDNRDFSNIDWLELTSNISYNNDNSYVSIYPEIENSWKYIHRRFKSELFKNNKVQSPRHLVVIELDRNGGRLVRGIFRADEESIKVAENPLYTEYKPNSIFDKRLRWTADKEISLTEYVNSKITNQIYENQ